ncbi:MAG TPA: hypothetical protein VIV12_01315 [Streptosporangiaceae bacterium]
MSEYQSYEFVALDRRLTAAEMAELRSISTRAEITPTRFWNEYQWGDLKADPAKLLARYFDVHVYFANWGTRRLMFRLPITAVDVTALQPYFPGASATLGTDRRARHSRPGERGRRPGGRLVRGWASHGVADAASRRAARWRPAHGVPGLAAGGAGRRGGRTCAGQQRTAARLLARAEQLREARRREATNRTARR